MPFVLPTPEELARMDWHKRERVLRSLRAYARQVGAYLEDAPKRRALTPEERERREVERRDYEREWGERVREEARRLAGEIA
jgi:hypothetical protein